MTMMAMVLVDSGSPLRSFVRCLSSLEESATLRVVGLSSGTYPWRNEQERKEEEVVVVVVVVVMEEEEEL
ncbi:hypothetical protein M0802_006835 [Mischocyttarus mexicanus]|nr:hypothetical protein M0802_006835 [Mischocyttarus mexicanus]